MKNCLYCIPCTVLNAGTCFGLGWLIHVYVFWQVHMEPSGHITTLRLFFQATLLNSVSFPYFSQQKPNSIDEPTKRSAQQWTPDSCRCHWANSREDLLSRVEGLWGLRKSLSHLLIQRVYPNLCAMLQERSMELPENGPFLSHEPNWRASEQENHTEDGSNSNNDNNNNSCCCYYFVIEVRREIPLSCGYMER